MNFAIALASTIVLSIIVAVMAWKVRKANKLLQYLCVKCDLQKSKIDELREQLNRIKTKDFPNICASTYVTTTTLKNDHKYFEIITNRIKESILKEFSIHINLFIKREFSQITHMLKEGHLGRIVVAFPYFWPRPDDLRITFIEDDQAIDLKSEKDSIIDDLMTEIAEKTKGSIPVDLSKLSKLEKETYLNKLEKELDKETA